MKIFHTEHLIQKSFFGPKLTKIKKLQKITFILNFTEEKCKSLSQCLCWTWVLILQFPDLRRASWETIIWIQDVLGYCTRMIWKYYGSLHGTLVIVKLTTGCLFRRTRRREKNFKFLLSYTAKHKLTHIRK